MPLSPRSFQLTDLFPLVEIKSTEGKEPRSKGRVQQTEYNFRTAEGYLNIPDALSIFSSRSLRGNEERAADFPRITLTGRYQKVFGIGSHFENCCTCINLGALSAWVVYESFLSRKMTVCLKVCYSRVCMHFFSSD